MIRGVDDTMLQEFMPVLHRPQDEVRRFREIDTAKLAETKIDTSAQSVHGVHVTAQVQETLYQLFEKYKYPENTNEQVLFKEYLDEYNLRLHNKITKTSKSLFCIKGLEYLYKLFRLDTTILTRNGSVDKINKTLLRIKIEDTKFLVYKTNKVYSLSQIFTKVYFMIKSLPKDLVEEGFIRLDQELEEAHEMCAVGHLNRLINVLSGFDILKTTNKMTTN